MSTTIKSYITNRTLIVKGSGALAQLEIEDHKGERMGVISAPAADLLTALRAEGVLDADDGLRGRVEALADDWNARSWFEAETALCEALNPKPSFVFPTGLGAVVEAQRPYAEPFKLIKTGKHWAADNSYAVWAEDDIRLQLTNLRTLSEGVEL